MRSAANFSNWFARQSNCLLHRRFCYFHASLIIKRVQFLFWCLPGGKQGAPEVYFQDMPKYSVVVPFHDEEDYVTALYDRLKAVMERWVTVSSWCLLTTDRAIALQAAGRDCRGGQPRAGGEAAPQLRADLRSGGGFDHAQGEFILAMDGDLQHDLKRFRTSWPSSKRATTL